MYVCVYVCVNEEDASRNRAGGGREVLLLKNIKSGVRAGLRSQLHHWASYVTQKACLIMCDKHGDNVFGWAVLLGGTANGIVYAEPLGHLPEDSALLVKCAQCVFIGQQIRFLSRNYSWEPYSGGRQYLGRQNPLSFLAGC